MIPKITFTYSTIYDEFHKKYLITYYKAYKDPRTKKNLKKYPSQKEIESYISKIEKLWIKDEKSILKAIEKVTGLKWKDKEIKVYVVGKCIAFADPVTMPVFKDKDDFIDTLTHELIHQIQKQTEDEKFDKWIKYVNKKYKNELKKTRSHIFLQAVHAKILLEIFGEKRLYKNVQKSIKEAYVKSWKIVEEEGYENIIEKFKKITDVNH